MLQESFLKPGRRFSIPDFYSVRSDRATAAGGGTVILLRSSMFYDKLRPPPTSSLESCGVMARILGGSVAIYSIYWPYQSDPLNDDSRSLLYSVPSVVIGGDLNSTPLCFKRKFTSRFSPLSSCC